MPGLILVRQLLGCDIAICSEDGAKLHALLKPELDAITRTPVVDFSNLRAVMVPFLQGAFHPFMERMLPEDLLRKVTFIGLTTHGETLMASVLDHSYRWHHDAGYRDAVTKFWKDRNED